MENFEFSFETSETSEIKKFETCAGDGIFFMDYLKELDALDQSESGTYKEKEYFYKCELCSKIFTESIADKRQRCKRCIQVFKNWKELDAKEDVQVTTMTMLGKKM